MILQTFTLTAMEESLPPDVGMYLSTLLDEYTPEDTYVNLVAQLPQVGEAGRKRGRAHSLHPQVMM
ncbi:hypothetical protein EYF80_008822 [Liparis tanakae]|uniref:Uncharacterized protein n=1 Tax=Liparis tanakae TaxID=230148 RepID=A0A4Z2ISS1_9TELE|nr:hypothetical protein EYF80_008822 [Liparis tanakae]